MGKISPKSKIRKVTTTISITKPSTGLVVKSNAVCTVNADKITMPTFTKLLLISMVASNSRGFSSRAIIICSLLFLEFRISSFAEAESEKNETSEPEIKPEKRSKTAIATKSGAIKTRLKSELIMLSRKLGGSVSKGEVFG